MKSIYLLVFLIGAICGYMSYAYITTKIHCYCSEDAKTLLSKFSHDLDGLDERQRRLYGNKSTSNNPHVTSTGVTGKNDTQHFRKSSDHHNILSTSNNCVLNTVANYCSNDKFRDESRGRRTREANSSDLLDHD